MCQSDASWGLAAFVPPHCYLFLLWEPGGVRGGCGDGQLFPWGPHWETWERAHARGLCVEEGSGTGVSPYRCPAVGPGKGGFRLPETFRVGWRGLKGWGVSLWRGSLWRALRGAPLLGVRGFGVMKGRLWGQASLFMGSRLLGTCRDAERCSRGGAFLSMGGLWREPGGRAALVEKALEMGISFHRDSGGEPGNGFIYQGLWEMKKTVRKERFWRGSVWRASGEGCFTGVPERCVKEIYQERHDNAL